MLPRVARLSIVCLISVCMSAAGLWAQDLENIQIHGFATQGFLFSSNNNYLTMKSSSGSLQWTEGAVNVSDAVTDNLRVGIQFHMYQMGQFGGPNVLVDWASGDYKFRDELGFRAGKVKLPFGLFNDSQDVDSLFVWVLIPQSMYPDDNRDFDLALLGGEVYGGLGLGRRGGRVQYHGYAGESRLDSHGGYVEQLAQVGLTFPTPPSGKVYGGDLRWVTPWHGLIVGSSGQSQSLDGLGLQGTMHMPADFMVGHYIEWIRGRWRIDAEYMRNPFELLLTMGGTTIPVTFDVRAWYPMISYRLSQKLHVGSYYSHYVNKAADTTLPANYSKDWVVSGRYDFNEYFYGKVEGHFLHGTGLGYYTSANPNGLRPNSNMLAARIGFSF